MSHASSNDSSATPAPLLKTPLHDLHVALGARMVPFAGYSMPVQYPAGLMAEHHHTRNAAGLFDVSHMGQLRLVGADSAAALETLIPVDVIDLPVGKQRYGLLLNDDGGIIDDLMFFNRDYLNGGDLSVARPPQTSTAPEGLEPAAPSLLEQDWTGDRREASRESHAVGERGGDIFIIVNGACKAGDIAHIRAKIGTRCQVVSSPERALLALQGPQAVSALQRLAPGVEKLVFMTGGRFTVQTGKQAIDVFLTRSGYTGEDGFEISVLDSQAEALARALLEQPEVKPIGLGARNSLRLEAGLCLYGNDIDTHTTPVEASLNWAIQKVRRSGGARAGGFPGAEKILAQLTDPAGTVKRKRVGLVALERIPVRDHSALHSMDGAPIGEVTSGLLGPTINTPVAMGYVKPEFAALGSRINAIVRGKPVPMEVSAMPFVANHYWRG